MKLSARIRARLREHLAAMPSRPTQQALADQMGATQSWVSHYLAGRHDADIDTLDRFAQAVQVDFASLVRPDGKPQSTLPREFAEPIVMLQAMTPEMRAHVIALMRELTRPSTQKRARARK